MSRLPSGLSRASAPPFAEGGVDVDVAVGRRHDVLRPVGNHLGRGAEVDRDPSLIAERPVRHAARLELVDEHVTAGGSDGEEPAVGQHREVSEALLVPEVGPDHPGLRGAVRVSGDDLHRVGEHGVDRPDPDPSAVADEQVGVGVGDAGTVVAGVGEDPAGAERRVEADGEHLALLQALGLHVGGRTGGRGHGWT